MLSARNQFPKTTHQTAPLTCHSHDTRITETESGAAVGAVRDGGGWAGGRPVQMERSAHVIDDTDHRCTTQRLLLSASCTYVGRATGR